MKKLHYVSTALMVLMLVFGSVAMASQEFGKGEANVNTATRDELVWFLGQTGISNASMVADNIIEYRDANGPFSRESELLKVKGIDQSVLDMIGYRIKVTGITDFDPEVVTPAPGTMLHTLGGDKGN